MNYREHFHNLISNKNARILEIGPLNKPLVSKTIYPNTLYCDIRSTSQVKELYTSSEYLETTGLSVPVEQIVDIDVVLTNGYEVAFADKPKFDYIVASHVLEHVEDLIHTLQDISSVLAPKGKFIIYYPDIRYCFDHFRAEASFRDAYDVYENKRPALSRMVLDFYQSAVPENNPSVFWSADGLHELLPVNDTAKALEMYKRSHNGEFMDDVHYWPFSDKGFIKFLYDLSRNNMIQLSCPTFLPTLENTQEFVLVLQKEKHWNRDSVLQQLRLHYSSACNMGDAIQQRQKAELEKQIYDMQQQAITSKAFNDELIQEVESIHQQKAELEKQIYDMQQQAITSKAFNDELIQEVEAGRATISIQDNHASQLQLQVNETIKELNAQLNNCVGFQQQLMESQGLLSEQLVHNIELKQQSKSVQQQFADAQARLSVQNANNVVLSQKLENLQSQLDECEDNNHTLQQQVADAQARLSVQTVTNSIMLKKLENALYQTGCGQTTIANLYQQAESLNHQLWSAQSQFEQALKQISSYEETILAYEQSTSWRLTKPVRVLKKLFRRRS